MTIHIDAEFQALIPALTAEEYAGLEQNIIENGCLDALKVWQPTTSASCETCYEEFPLEGIERLYEHESICEVYECPHCSGVGRVPYPILIDGHNRYEICTEHGIEFETQLLSFADRLHARVWIRKNQFDRRNLNDLARLELAEGQASDLREIGRAKQVATLKQNAKQQDSVLSTIDKTVSPEPQKESVIDKAVKPKIQAHDTRKEIAKQLGWSTGKVAMGQKVMKKAPTPVKEKIRSGEMSINQAYKEIKKDERKEQQIEKERQLVIEAPETNDKYILTDAQDVVECAALITDPPYGILTEAWEPKDLEHFTRAWAERWNECGADTLSIFWSQRFLMDGRKWFDESFSKYNFQQLLVWVYRNNKSPQSRKGFKQTWEPVFFYRKKESQREIGVGAGSWGDDCHDMDSHIAAVPQSNFNDENMKVHPAQKPVSAFRWLINATTNPGEKIADPFVGSGTSGIAALQLGRTFHGIEIDSDMRKTAENRIKCYGRL